MFVGIEIDGKLEEIPYGTYIIEKPDNEEVVQKTSFTGYDYMIKFNAKYENRVGYPIKLSELFANVCDQVGLEIGNTNFPNADYMVIGNPFTDNEDCRTVLSNIAQLAGGFAKIGRDNKVYIRTLKKAPKGLLKVKDVHNMPVQDLHVIPIKMLSSYRDSSDDYIDGMNYFDDFSKNEQWGEVNSVVLSLSDIEGENTARTDEESIAQNGLTEITIADNYFLINEEERNKVIEELWERLSGIYYLPFKTKYYGYPHLDSGDIIAIDDTKDNQGISYVFNHTFTYNGAFSGNLETIAMTKTQTAYKNTQDMKSKFRRVERSVDKINGEIVDIIEFEDDTTKKLSEHKQTIDSITDTVSAVETNLENNYYTKTQTNSQINQKADSITSEVNKSITNAKDEVLEEANSKIEQTAESINSEVSKKVGSNEIISKINQSAEKVQINANKISLKGKEIDLTGEDIIIKSDNFNVDENGKVSIIDEGFDSANLTIINKNNEGMKVFSDGIDIFPSDQTIYPNKNISLDRTSEACTLTMQFHDGNGSLMRKSYTVELMAQKGASRLWLTDLSQSTTVRHDGITTSGTITAPIYSVTDAGTVMYGMTKEHAYMCHWTGSQLQFYVDSANVVTLSDKRLKKNIKNINESFIKAIKEVEMKQFKVANRGGLITFGILAQDLIEVFEKYDINPFEYEIVYKTKYRIDDDTIYYGVNYEQFLILKAKVQELEIKELREKDKQKDEMLQDLRKRVEALEKGANNE